MLINSTAAGRNGNDDRGHRSSNGTPAIFNNWTPNPAIFNNWTPNPAIFNNWTQNPAIFNN